MFERFALVAGESNNNRSTTDRQITHIPNCFFKLDL